MKTTEEKIAIMQAFVDGKEIEYKSHKAENGDLLRPNKHVTEPTWNWPTFDYRIKEDMDQKAWDLYKKTVCLSPKQTHDAMIKDGMRAVIDAVKRGDIT
jgi:hypothetical protein